MRIVLDGIDDIDWQRLGHAYGTARDVPRQLAALRSADPQVREQALRDLYGNIFHQGTRYQATAYAVPFLLELLADPQTPNRSGICGLLSSIAIGYDSSLLPDPLPIAEHRAYAEGGEAVLAAAPAPRDDDDFDSDDFDEDGEEEDWAEEEEDYDFSGLSEEDQNRLYAYFVVRAYDAVRAGVPVLLGLLDDAGEAGDSDTGLQAQAVYTLGWFPEEAPAILPRLSAVASERQRDEAVVGTALVSIGLLGGKPEPAFLEDPRPLVRWGAAVALRDREELTVWVTGNTDGDPRIPFLDGDLGGLASLALGRLGADAAFDALLARIPAVSGSAALPTVGEALRLAFPQGPLPAGADAASLDARQRELAQALADSPSTWRYKGMAFGNFSQLVTAYGLPRSSDELARFLSATPI